MLGEWISSRMKPSVNSYSSFEYVATWQIPVILTSKVTPRVPQRSVVVMIYLRPQFALPRDDIPTIGLREIVWDIHFGQESALDLRRRSDALGPPVGERLKRTTH